MPGGEDCGTIEQTKGAELKRDSFGNNRGGGRIG